MSTKDSLCIIMAIIAHFDFELYKMDVRIIFLNGDLVEDVYMSQSSGFDDVVIAHGFKENIVDQRIYMKVSGSKFIFLVLYVDDILLAANVTNLPIETKQLLFSHFDMKDLREASYVLGIQILHDKPSGILRLSQQTYIERILKRFNMQSCSSGKAPIVKGVRFSKGQCLQNNIDR